MAVEQAEAAPEHAQRKLVMMEHNGYQEALEEWNNNGRGARKRRDAGCQMKGVRAKT